VLPGEPVRGRPTYLVVAKATGKPTLNSFISIRNWFTAAADSLAETHWAGILRRLITAIIAQRTA
jgi:hypothetical protein